MTPKTYTQENEASFGLFFSSWKVQDVAWKTGKKNTIIVNFNEKHEWNYQLLQRPLPECPDQGLSKPNAWPSGQLYSTDTHLRLVPDGVQRMILAIQP